MSKLFNLNEHVWVHSNENPLSYSLCNKEFCEPFNLNQHIWVHSNENPLKCSLRNKKFPNFLIWMSTSEYTQMKTHSAAPYVTRNSANFSIWITDFCESTFTESRDREWDFSRKFLRVENENESSGGKLRVEIENETLEF